MKRAAMVLLATLVLLPGCGWRSAPDGVTGIDFSLTIDAEALAEVIQRQGTPPPSTTTQVENYVGWVVIATALARSGSRTEEGPRIPGTTEVILRVYEDGAADGSTDGNWMVSQRHLHWGANDWHQPLWPGTFHLQIDVSGPQGRAVITSAPIELQSGDSFAADFDLHPPATGPLPATATPPAVPAATSVPASAR